MIEKFPSTVFLRLLSDEGLLSLVGIGGLREFHVHLLRTRLCNVDDVQIISEDGLIPLFFKMLIRINKQSICHINAPVFLCNCLMARVINVHDLLLLLIYS